MNAFEKARMAVIDVVMNEAGLEKENPEVSIKTNVISMTEDNSGAWHAMVSADAHTDRNYLVRYHPELARTTVETFVKTDRANWIPDKPANNDEPPSESLDHPFHD